MPSRMSTTGRAFAGWLAVLVCVALTAVSAGSAMSGAPAKSAPAKSAPAPATTPTAGTPAPPTSERPRYGRLINGVPDTGQFLPDTTMLGRVNEHRITVGDYVSSYFNAYAEDRPGPDSLGRVAFLNAMINKEVLGRTARAAGYQPTFEDRSVMREYEERLCSNILYLREVYDSSAIDPGDVERVYQQFGYELHVRHILFADQITAERVRLLLVRGQLSWRQAVAAYSQAPKDSSGDGDGGWIIRVGLTYDQAEVLYNLKPGEISPIVYDADGPEIYQVVERRKVPPMSYGTVHSVIVDQLHTHRASLKEQRLFDLMTKQIGFVLDTANVAWAAKFFPVTRSNQQTGREMELNFNVGVPQFGADDTSRVLAHWNAGKMTLGEFVIFYSEISALLRPPVNTPDLLGHQVANFVLEPYRAQLARAKGYDKDPRVLAQMDMRREQLLVEHMYEDSVASKVTVTQAERRKYYDDHKSGFVTYASRRFATILRSSQAGADSLVRQLRAGVKAWTILDADSTAGYKSGAIHDLREDEHSPFRRVVYEELKPGEVTTVGPEKDGGFIVIQLVAVTPGHQLTFEESQTMADDNLRNMKSEAELQRLLGRLKPKFHIEQRPQWVMRVRLLDPTL